MQTKYDIGQTAMVQVHIERINVDSGGEAQYFARVPARKPACDWFDESVLEDGDFIPVEDYEREINELKDEIERLRDMYQHEHMKVVKLASMPSHNPQDNIYSDDWRRP